MLSPALLLALAFLLGVVVTGLARRSVYRDRARLRAELARAEAQAREQTRMVGRMRSEQGTVASLALSLPNVVRELNRSDFDPRRVPSLIVQLADAIFQPGQLLFYETRRKPGEERRRQELHLAAHKGLGSMAQSIEHVAFGEGKIGWVAQMKIDMLKDAWINLTRNNGEIVGDNHPALDMEIMGPLTHYDMRFREEEVLGVLCVGSLGVRPRDEKLMFQMVTNLGSLALVNADYRSKLREQANHDGLTGLLNKRYFMDEVLGQMIFDAEQSAQKLALFIFDIDHFKAYNDHHGHPAGDELLRRMATLLRSSLRPGDLCCRYGGEEFILAMPEADGPEAMQIAERIRRVIEEHTFPNQEEQPNGNLTISGGVAVFPKDGTSATELTRHADEALYQAKRGGRNRVVRYRGVAIGDAGDEIDMAPAAIEDGTVSR